MNLDVSNNDLQKDAATDVDALPLLAESITEMGVRLALAGLSQYVWMGVMIITRLSGLVLIAPVFGHPQIPLQIRGFLVLALAFVLVPIVGTTSGRDVFVRLDLNHDGQLAADEVPPALEAVAATLRQRAGKGEDESLQVHEFLLPAILPRSLLELTGYLIGEFALGLALGLGVLAMMSGISLAGQLIDQQTGASFGEMYNPELDTTGAVSGELLYGMGTLLLLVTGCHHLLIDALVETLRIIPVGYATVTHSAIDLLRDLVQQSLLLSLQVAAPIMVTMAVAALAMGFLGHTVPQINIFAIGFPVRALIGFCIIWLALPRLADVMQRTLPEVILQLRQALGSG